MKDETKIVVSRYAERLDWLGSVLDAGAVESAVVYNKGSAIEFADDRVEVRQVNNVGREGGTYLDYIIKNYDNLPARVWFSQGDPLEHSPDFVGLLGESAVVEYANRGFQGLTDRWRGECPGWFGFDSLSLDSTTAWRVAGKKCVKYFIDKDLNTVGHCEFKDLGLIWMRESFESMYGKKHMFGHMAGLAGIPEPKPITEFFYSACFFASRETILSNPVSSYEALRSFLYESDPQGGFQGYLLERFWPYLFTRRSYDTLTDCYRSELDGEYMGVYNPNEKTLRVKRNEIVRVSHNRNSTLVFRGGKKVIPCLDFDGRDLFSRACDSLEEAKRIMGSLIPSSGEAPP